MTETLDLLPKYQRLYFLLKERGIDWDPETGEAVYYRGQAYIICAVRDNTLALLDDLADIPLTEEALLYVENWETDPTLIWIPRLEGLLRVIWERTSLHPIMTPGIEAARRVWQVLHPACDPIIARSLQEALLELAIRVLEVE